MARSGLWRWRCRALSRPEQRGDARLRRDAFARSLACGVRSTHLAALDVGVEEGDGVEVEGGLLPLRSEPKVGLRGVHREEALVEGLHVLHRTASQHLSAKENIPRQLYRGNVRTVGSRRARLRFAVRMSYVLDAIGSANLSSEIEPSVPA
eukprot:1182667-Prorocentrum_minimum.AAC.7